MGEQSSEPVLEAANTFRHGLFQCFFEPDITMREQALKTLGHVVDFWTQSWLEHHSRTPRSPSGARPSIARHSSSGSGVSSNAGSLLRRDSTLMNFDDIFGVDGDDVFHNPRRKESITSAAPSTPDREDIGWAPFLADCAIASSPSLYQEAKFPNHGLRTIHCPSDEINRTKGLVAEETWELEQMRVNLDNFFTWLLRFSVDCPHPDVRKGCKSILRHAEKAGAQLPILPHVGPSAFVPLSDTIGLEYPEPVSVSAATLSGNTPSPFDSDEDEDGSNASPRDSFPTGIMIPNRQRSRSKVTMPALGSFGKTTKRAAASLISTLFQTPPSPNAGYKPKRRTNSRRPLTKFLPKAKEPSGDVRALQMHTYARTGRINNFNKVLFMFPQFAEVNRRLTDLILSGDSLHGPLPQTWRVYLGVLAAAEKRCQYFLTMLSEKFLTVGGPVSWLQGIKNSPPKLQKIAHLNRSLAHLPWTISPNTIWDLVRGDDGLESRWSVSEVVEALLILAFYHGKSALALAWGILPEPDLLGGTVKTSIPVAPFGSFAPSAAQPVSVAMEPSLDRFGMRGKSAGSLGLSNTTRTIENDEKSAEGIGALPATGPVIPSGSIPYSTTLETDYLSLGNLDSQPPGSALGTTIKIQKRRKSFDEVGTSDGPFTLRPTISTSSLSASVLNVEPFSLYSSMTGGGNPLSVLKDTMLSPSSSASSVIDTASFVERANGTNLDGYGFTKFLDSSETMTFDQLDPNNTAPEWLPMEEFPWDNAACILGSYLDSCVDLLDEYFKEAMEVDAESLASSFSSIKPDILLGLSDQTAFFASSSTQGVEQDRSVHECRDFGLEFEARPNSMQRNIEYKTINEAAWYYSLRLVNIQKDDFRYSDIKFALQKSTRRYLKLVCIQPAAVCSADWIGVQGLNTEEKCRMGLLVTQARFLGELLWGLKAVSEFL